jgi:gamma-glutamylcyclotransferase (GGCT)/AIG2-like uncharacterized protein YtfP
MLQAKSLFSGLSSQPTVLMFFYGTLKRGFHWQQKFLPSHLARFVGPARTKHLARLVVGACGVPYCFFQQEAGCLVRGELWEVKEEALSGLDDYEGCGKGHYVRQMLEFVDEQGANVKAFAYAPNGDFAVRLAAELDGQEHLEEYTMELHARVYCPIQHIEVKQRLYLQELEDDKH